MPRGHREGGAGAGEALSLREVSARLGVHYMTVYRYVRTGRLAASKRGATWSVDRERLENLRASGTELVGRRGRPHRRERVRQLTDRLVAGDEGGAWALVQSLLGAGASPVDVHTEVLIPALRTLGERWAAGNVGVAGEHGASGVAQRLVGRMGPLFRRRGRPRGTLVLGAPEGEQHGLPTALAADRVRASGFAVLDLGANVPTASFVEYAGHVPALVAVGVSVTTPGRSDPARRLVAALRGAGLGVPIIAGGAGIGAAEAAALGADHWAAEAAGLVELLAERHPAAV